jgi:PAS domain S-box-containing protein
MASPVVSKVSVPDPGRLVTALFDDAPTPQMLIGRGGLLVRVNQALCAWTGYTSLELTGASVRALNDPLENVVLAGEMASLWRGETDAIRREKKYIAKDGSVQWGELTATRVTNAEEGTDYIQAVIVVTTDRHRAESALRSSETRYRDLVEKLPGYAYRSNTDEIGSSTYISPQVEELFGFKPSEYLLNPGYWAESIHPDDRTHVLAEFAENVRTGAGFRVEYRIHDAAGAIHWVLDHGIVVNPEDGEPAYVQGIVLDITDSKLTEIARAESVAKSRLLTAMVEIGGLKTLAEVGRATVDQARALLHSDSSTVTWFDPRDDSLRAIADTDPLGILPLGRDATAGAMGAAFQGGAPVILPDYPNWSGALKVEKSRVPASVLVVPLRVHDRITGALAVATRAPRAFSNADVSTLSLLGAHAAPALELALLLEQLKESNSELVTASRAKSEFLAAMSHELRTPLNSILGFAQLLQLGQHGRLGERQQRYVGNIQTSGDHLLTLIDGVLDLVKLETGRIELQPELTSLEDVLRVAITTLEPLAAAKGLRLALDCQPDVSLVVDQFRLTQVILNLASNAIKFTHHGHVKLSAKTAAGSVVVTIADTGIGIPREQLDRIFAAFVQVDGGIGRSEGGTGLGLALARDLVERMGGQIAVTSKPGSGSVFTVTLPADRSPDVSNS